MRVQAALPCLFILARSLEYWITLATIYTEDSLKTDTSGSLITFMTQKRYCKRMMRAWYKSMLNSFLEAYIQRRSSVYTAIKHEF